MVGVMGRNLYAVRDRSLEYRTLGTRKVLRVSSDFSAIESVIVFHDKKKGSLRLLLYEKRF